jgi:hypothetical protein
MNGESNRREFRPYHPEKQPRTKDDDEEDWDVKLNRRWSLVLVTVSQIMATSPLFARRCTSLLSNVPTRTRSRLGRTAPPQKGLGESQPEQLCGLADTLPRRP